MVRREALAEIGWAKFKPVIPEKVRPKFRLNKHAFSIIDSENKWFKANELSPAKYLSRRNIGLEEISSRSFPPILSNDVVVNGVYILFPESPSMQGWSKEDITNFGFPVSHLLYRNSSDSLLARLTTELGVITSRDDRNQISSYSSLNGDNILVPLNEIDSSEQCMRLLGVNQPLIYGGFDN